MMGLVLDSPPLHVQHWGTCNGYHGTPACSDPRCFHYDPAGLVRWFIDRNRYCLRIGGGAGVARVFDRGDAWVVDWMSSWWHAPGWSVVATGSEAVACVVKYGLTRGVEVPQPLPIPQQARGER